MVIPVIVAMYLGMTNGKFITPTSQEVLIIVMIHTKLMAHIMAYVLTLIPQGGIS